MNSGLRTLKMQFLYRHEPLGNAASILFALLALPGFFIKMSKECLVV